MSQAPKKKKDLFHRECSNHPEPIKQHGNGIPLFFFSIRGISALEQASRTLSLDTERLAQATSESIDFFQIEVDVLAQMVLQNQMVL